MSLPASPRRAIHWAFGSRKNDFAMTSQSLLATCLATALPICAARTLAHWTFDELVTAEPGRQAVLERAGGGRDAVSGNAWLVRGVRGQALQFDGITSHIVRKEQAMPALEGPFTVEAWIAIGAYPFNWAPLLQQQDSERTGFFFGVGDRGQLRFGLAAGGKWHSAESDEGVPLRQWAHVAGVYSPAAGVAVFLNGRKVAGAPVEGTFQTASQADVWIARNKFQLEQSNPVGANRQSLTNILFDGILDELILSAGAKSEMAIAAAARHEGIGAPPLNPRVLPAGPPGPGPFGAYYAKLAYYRGWDEYWRTAESPDIVVRFEKAPYRLVFWRGTSYIPHWVTENGIWYTNEFVESFQKGLQGSAEPMSDKQCRLSSVRIVESSEARVVVHWRYAPIDINYKFAWVDPLTGWGDWTDEVHTLYPDGVGVREITVHTSTPDVRREFHEGIVVMSPGMNPTDAIEPAGLTLVNDDGVAHTLSWEEATPPKYPKDPPGATIQVVNTKSRYRPFAAGRLADRPVFDVYASEVRREVSIFPWWNHWPTAFEPSNGRYAVAADRASSSSLSHMTWQPYDRGRGWLTKVMLQGMTDRPPAELAAVARSWSLAPRLRISGGDYEGGEYDAGERAYKIVGKPGIRGPLDFTVEANERSPIRNLALIVEQWGDDEPVVRVDGIEISRTTGLRHAQRPTIGSTDLVLWIPMERVQTVRITVARRR